MKRLLLAVLAVSIAGLLVACEQPQTATGSRSDAKAWQGAPDSPFVAAGWKPGDEASWNEHIRLRAETQNEYNRVR
jgi:hypothetical protein